MKVLLVHNYYQQAGGEDTVYRAEKALLQQADHEVVTYERQNAEIGGSSTRGRVGLLADTIWARDSARTLREIIRREQPEVVHFHNTFPLISPAAYYTAQSEGVPVVQTLHNYRLLCPNALFFRDGHVCEDCLGKMVPWPGVLHACYRQSRAASAAVTTMLTTHRLIRTWREQVDVYIALSEFARQKFIQGGLPASKIVVKPNFVQEDPGPGDGPGEYALFVGRLSPEKGLDVLLEAWNRLEGRMPLKIVGDGPCATTVSTAARRLKSVEWLGSQSREAVTTLMQGARFLLVPSVLYENCPMVVVEAYAAGLPIIASKVGSIAEVVIHGRNGFHFRVGDPEDLVAQVEKALANPIQLAAMRRGARAEFEVKYSREQNYRMLMQVYASARGGAATKEVIL